MATYYIIGKISSTANGYTLGTTVDIIVILKLPII